LDVSPTIGMKPPWLVALLAAPGASLLAAFVLLALPGEGLSRIVLDGRFDDAKALLAWTLALFAWLLAPIITIGACRARGLTSREALPLMAASAVLTAALYFAIPQLLELTYICASKCGV
jgi:hypothetical protein